MNPREKQRERNKRYYQNHKDEQREHSYRYYREHRDEMLEKGRQRYQKHREERLVTMRQYSSLHSQTGNQKYLYGSVERYNEAMLKYEGECAFACGKKAEAVHHIDGKACSNSPKQEVDNRLSNLLPLCKGCHNWVHKRRINKRNQSGQGRRNKWSVKNVEP